MMRDPSIARRGFVPPPRGPLAGLPSWQLPRSVTVARRAASESFADRFRVVGGKLVQDANLDTSGILLARKSPQAAQS